MKVNSYCNTVFSHNSIPIINKSTSVTNHNDTTIDQNLTNCFDSKINSRILKVYISDHFPMFFTSKSINVKASHDLAFVTKRNTSPFTFSLLKEKLHEADWGFLNAFKDPIEAFKTF